MAHIRRLVMAVLASVALLVGTAAPAGAALPPPPTGSAVIQNSIWLEIEVAVGSTAWLVSPNRSITLATGTYAWKDQIYWPDYDLLLEQGREIDLVGGEYQWNCVVVHTGHTNVVGMYRTYCYLYRKSAPGIAYTPDLNFTLDNGNVYWRSILHRIR